MTKQSEASSEDKGLVKVEEDSSKGQQKSEPEQARTAPRSASKGSGIFAKLAVILLIVIVILLAGGGYYFYELYLVQNQQLKSQQSTISSLQQSMDETIRNVSTNQSQSASITTQLQALTEKVQQTENVSQQAMAIVNRNQRDWAIAEVNYLLRMANQRLAVARDIEGAIAALKGADKRLGELGDLRLLKIRKQLAKDIASLSSIHQADVNGISMVMDELINHVNQLPFKSVESEIKAQLEKQEPEEKAAEASPDLFDSIMNTVKQIGDIKVHKRSIETASSSDQQMQIEQQLRSYLLSARLAVLSLDQKQFSQDLKLSIELLKKYYDIADNRVQSLLEQLSEYDKIELRPSLPELTMAWEMLQKQVISEQSSDLNQQQGAGEEKPEQAAKNVSKEAE